MPSQNVYAERNASFGLLVVARVVQSYRSRRCRHDCFRSSGVRTARFVWVCLRGAGSYWPPNSLERFAGCYEYREGKNQKRILSLTTTPFHFILFHHYDWLHDYSTSICTVGDLHIRLGWRRRDSVGVSSKMSASFPGIVVEQVWRPPSQS